MRLGYYMGYAPPGTNPLELVELAQEAERLGYDSAWAAEAWGTDAVTVLTWIAATTTRIKVGSAIMQIPGRSPANTAMTAATLDLMSNGRFLLGLGTSGPQVVEGWHGQPWGKPLKKTREYVEIVRTILRREVLEHHGEHYDIPYTGPGATGLDGYEAEARQIQDLFLEGKRNEAAAAVPDAFVDRVALVGPKERMADRVEAFREAGATTLLVSTRQPEALRAVAELVL